MDPRTDRISRWKPRLAGLALTILAVTLGAVAGGVGPRDGLGGLLAMGPTIVWTLVGVLLAAGIVLLLSSLDRRGDAWLRLDWFLPMLRRQATPDRSASSVLGRSVRRLVPRSWQSDWTTKRRGPVRRVLRLLGPSWLAAPLRRVVQGVCLVTFCVLFFYTCWPYDARPRQDRPVGEDWTFVRFQQESGRFEFAADLQASTDSAARTPAAGDRLFLLSRETPPGTDDRGVLGEFVVESTAPRDDGGALVELAPAADLSPAMMALVVGDGGEHRYTAHREDPLAWPSHYADNLASKEWIPAETFLAIDPLVSLSTAVASRSWVWSLISAAAILLICVLVPRGFCGYLCPLGTTIDLFDWAVTGRTGRLPIPDQGWWVHTKYYLLAGILVAAGFGVLLSGFFAAIPVITRGLLFVVDPLQTGVLRGWHLVPPLNAGHAVSIVLFLGVLSLGFLRPRFWCKYVCPSGAVFSLGNLFRVTERKVESSCIHCNKCVEVCPFDAIKPDFTTRETDCTLCQTCAGVCPTHAIKFVERWNLVQLKVDNDPPTRETALGRRGFLSLAVGSAAAVVGGSAAALGTKAFGAQLGPSLPILPGPPPGTAFWPVRPPGSVPEREFLEMCIRCGECFKACPNNVLQPEGFQQGLEGLWTPLVNADWAGCESSCNACGQVCPTGAIRALPLEEKRSARMGLAIVNEVTCLPFAGEEACDLCVQECNAAGYEAIEYTQVGVEVDERGRPIEGTGFAAPVVLTDKCVGCGLCQTRCHAINVKDRHVLTRSAIVVAAGDGKDDRILTGSYRELHAKAASAAAPRPVPEPEPAPPPSPFGDDPFGAGPFGAGPEVPDADAGPGPAPDPAAAVESPF